jgi:hypothetical protein
MMRGDPVFTGLTTTELRALVEPVTDKREEIEGEMEARDIELGRIPGRIDAPLWRRVKEQVCNRIHSKVYRALHWQAGPMEYDDGFAFLDARCARHVKFPCEEDILMATEISRWHTRKDIQMIQENMYRALVQVLGLPGGLLSESQKVLAMKGYLHAMESHFMGEGGQDVWVLNSVKWCKMELAKQKWDNNTELWRAMHLTLHGGLGYLVLSEVDTKWVRNAYIISVDPCEYNDKPARMNWAVNWVAKKITENRAQPDEETRKALVDESLLNEAKQSHKRLLELYRQDREAKRLMLEVPLTSREEVLAKLGKRHDILRSQRDLLRHQA